MSTTSKNPNGTFIWREIMTPDVAASKRFYGEVFGWKFDEMPMDGFTYTMIMNGEKGVGGMASLDSMPGAPPHWIGTVCVADVDTSAKLAGDLGGTVMMPPGDIPGYGRFAVILDPQGAPLTLMCPTGESNGREGPPGLGEFCWEHINTTDAAGTKAFFGKLLGWEAGTMPAGMEVFTLNGNEVASVSDAPPGAPTHWLTYVVVDELASARGRVTNNGGKVILEEQPVPGIGTFSVVTDNVGATLCLFKGQG
ncbi:MAG: VOC family protein [Deltaproteobacteria bacterium]|nr:VOC family protein [Myxococcales bacterium]MDP3220826.1 VOC family protein [Deltaproteobacteria bacterium]